MLGFWFTAVVLTFALAFSLRILGRRLAVTSLRREVFRAIDAYFTTSGTRLLGPHVLKSYQYEEEKQVLNFSEYLAVIESGELMLRFYNTSLKETPIAFGDKLDFARFHGTFLFDLLLLFEAFTHVQRSNFFVMYTRRYENSTKDGVRYNDVAFFFQEVFQQYFQMRDSYTKTTVNGLLLPTCLRASRSNVDMFATFVIENAQLSVPYNKELIAFIEKVTHKAQVLDNVLFM